jgi:3-phenylpropionate/trans-cinnamate dioxygenase ferredoxin reductase component
VAECDAIKQEAAAGRRAVVVGMEFIGCEVAASLTQLGVHVTVVFPGKAPLERVLGGQVGALIGPFHRASGVELLAGDQVAAFEGTERLEAVVTASGHRVGCDFAVAGIGVVPDVPAVAGSSITEDNRILADELCRASAADVYVAGDVANHLHPPSGGSGSSISTTRENRALRRRGPCSARRPRVTTSIASGPISTSTNRVCRPRREVGRVRSPRQRG